MKTFKYITGKHLDHPLVKKGFFDHLPGYKNHEKNEFGVGEDNPKGLKMQFDIKDQKVVCKHKLDINFVGPPGFVHGGILATMLDDIMGSAVMSVKPTTFNMTAKLTTHFLAPVFLDKFIYMEGWVEKIEGKKTFAQAAIYSEDMKQVLVEAESLFIEVKSF